MTYKVRPYVVAVNHVEGCTRRRCGPGCKRVTAGWEVDIILKLPDGKVNRWRVKSPASSKSGTQEWAARLEAEKLDDQHAPEPEEIKVVPTMKDFEPNFMSYSETNNKPSSVFAKRVTLDNHLLPHFGSTRLDRINAAEIEAYKAKKLGEKLAPKTVNNHLTVLRKLLNLAAEWGKLDHPPRVKALRVEQRDVQFLGFDEEPRFIAAADSTWRPMVHAALKTGLRIGELLALKWEDVDLAAGKLMVRRTLWRDQEGSPKGGRQREVPLGDDIIATLKAHRATTLLKGPYVFCDAMGSRLSHKKVSAVVPRICKKAGLAKRLTMHDLRHSYASHLVMRGVTLKAVQELLGHSTLDMTLRYAHLSPDVKRDAVKLLDRKNAPKLGDILETGS